jgi:hypothetical protein
MTANAAFIASGEKFSVSSSLAHRLNVSFQVASRTKGMELLAHGKHSRVPPLHHAADATTAGPHLSTVPHGGGHHPSIAAVHRTIIAAPNSRSEVR